MLPRENVNFHNLRNAIFWHSGTDVCIITDAVTTKLKGNFCGPPPLSHHIFWLAPPSHIFWHAHPPPPIKSHQPPS